MASDQTSTPKETEELHERPVKTVVEGAGPLYHRRYSVEIPGYGGGAEALIREVLDHLNEFTPQWLARFERPAKEKHRPVQEGDEILVKILGPWNGPVRVGEIKPHSFTLLTLAGHLESGRITFRARGRKEGGVRFEIESFSRSKDRLVDIVYDKLGFAKFMQTRMWSAFCRAVAEAFGGVPERPVKVRTERCSEDGEFCEVL